MAVFIWSNPLGVPWTTPVIWWAYIEKVDVHTPGKGGKLKDIYLNINYYFFDYPRERNTNLIKPHFFSEDRDIKWIWFIVKTREIGAVT